MTEQPVERARPALWALPADPALADLVGDGLPRPPGVVRRFWMRHARLADVIIAIAALVAGYVESIDTGAGLPGADWLVHGFFAVPVVAAGILLWRRSRPLLTLGVVIACGVVLTLAVGTTLGAPTVAAIYAVAVYRSAIAAWIGAAVAYGAFLLAALLTGHHPIGAPGLLILLLFALLFGINIGARRRYLDALILRAQQLARERDQQAQLATAAERARIAREMHDVVAHGLSVMVRLSDGANAVAEQDPDAARRAVSQIGEVGRDALRDMRRLLGVLRDEDAPAETSHLTPQPTLADLAHLVETYRSAGLPVAIRTTGTPPDDDGVQLLVYRSVQEALTNALRYAKEPARVLVQLDFTAGAEIVVTDDGFLPGPQASVGSGRGLIGLRERAALYGGSVEAGPLGSDGSGWRLRVTLPRTAEGER
ncbi:sensor histidine kinase [Frondihabitans sp. 762G35]|uniref:sensor histidine kinase n=1 Tax=Frondihabitans sp. 762G35 TaxID=1446794 RepID=UPI0013DC1EFA|nr:histidine kinase [Frondihabitans sp. 762G35]